MHAWLCCLTVKRLHGCVLSLYSLITILSKRIIITGFSCSNRTQVGEDDAVVAVMIVEASMHNDSISDMAAVLHSHFPQFPEDAHKYVTGQPTKQLNNQPSNSPTKQRKSQPFNQPAKQPKNRSFDWYSVLCNASC